jgi:hypothetical protein
MKKRNRDLKVQVRVLGGDAPFLLTDHEAN